MKYKPLIVPNGRTYMVINMNSEYTCCQCTVPDGQSSRQSFWLLTLEKTNKGVAKAIADIHIAMRM